MNSDIYCKYFYFHKEHILKIKMHMKNFCKYIMGAGRSPANYGFGHLPDFELKREVIKQYKVALDFYFSQR